MNLNCTDLEVNTLVWKCLGYRYDEESKVWKNDECFKNWKAKFPSPPDLIGMQRIYDKEIDNPSLKSNQALVRSIPAASKQNLKQFLKPYGFTGYKLEGLTPNKTRRAQCTNWLLYYKNDLYGVSMEELLERKKQRQIELKKEQEKLESEGEKVPWRPPLDEAY